MFKLCVCVMHMWKSEDNLKESALFYHKGLGEKLQVVRLDGKCLCMLNHSVALVFLHEVPVILCRGKWISLRSDVPCISAGHLTQAAMFLVPVNIRP